MSNHDASDASGYYRSINDSEFYAAFSCLDDQSSHSQLVGAVQHSNAKNFLVDFSDEAAWAGFNLTPRAISALFDLERPESLSTRWINIWYPHQQRAMLEQLAARYDFSPRLLALMCSDPTQQDYANSHVMSNKPNDRKLWGHRTSCPVDVEAQAEGQFDEISEHSSISSIDSVVGGNLYKIADSIWHYSSVDFGRQYVCIGFNSLYGTKHHSDERRETETPLPQCTRVWTWLLLCEDNTVISINEDPFPRANGRLTTLQLRIIAETRRNLLNVFRSLSRVQDKPLMAHNPMTLLPIRLRQGNTPQETAHRDSDAPGLLFYYLFENWHNSYTLVTRKESRYGIELTSLRNKMFERPKLVHIDRLDRIGQELGVLRRHYASYDRIIDRLLEPQNISSVSLQNSQIVSTASQASLDTIRPLVTEKESVMGVALSSAARVRFKRLRDLIDLYALSEVEEYIKQKEALVAMNFNLIAIKQSIDVDRLTRITLLLTKATFLFLPVSLATSYFSTQLDGVEYTVSQYWISFAVILFCSWLALFLFGVFNGNVQTTQVLLALWKGLKLGGKALCSGVRGESSRRRE